MGAFPRNARGFTLLELLTVIGMIALIMGALTVSVGAAQDRARIQKATAEVKSVTQAIMSTENLLQGYELPTMNERDVDKSSIGFLLGTGSSATGAKLPVTLMAALNSGGKMVDPWGTPYKITIREGTVKIGAGAASGSIQTGFSLPNYYRLSAKERQ